MVTVLTACMRKNYNDCIRRLLLSEKTASVILYRASNFDIPVLYKRTANSLFAV